MVPEEVRRLFQVLTGEDMTDADEDALFVVAAALESGAATVESLAPVVGHVVERVRGGFSGKATDRFAQRLEAFGPVLESGGAGVRQLAEFARNLALQVQYLKFVTVGGLLLLVAEIAWAVAMAGPTGGASMAWLAARFAVMRLLLTRWWGQLFMRLAMAQIVGIGLQVVMDAGAQGLQFALGTRKKWDAAMSEMAVGVGSFSGLLAVPLSALGNVVGNAIAKVLVRGLGDKIDAEVLAAAARQVAEEHAEQYPVASMAKFADVVSKNLEDYTGMSVRAMWVARFGHGLGESLEEGLTEMLGEAGYGAISGQGAQWNPFSFTAGVSEAIGSGIGNLAGLAVRGELIPAGRAREDTGGEKDSASTDTDTAGELQTESGMRAGEKPGFTETFSEKPGSPKGMSDVDSGIPAPGSKKVVATELEKGWPGVAVTSAVLPIGTAPGKTSPGDSSGTTGAGTGAVTEESAGGLSSSPGAGPDSPAHQTSVPDTGIATPAGAAPSGGPGQAGTGAVAGEDSETGVPGTTVVPPVPRYPGEAGAPGPDRLGTPPPPYSAPQGQGHVHGHTPEPGDATGAGTHTGTPPPAYSPSANALHTSPESAVDSPSEPMGPPELSPESESESGLVPVSHYGPPVSDAGATTGIPGSDAPPRNDHTTPEQSLMDNTGDSRDGPRVSDGGVTTAGSRVGAPPMHGPVGADHANTGTSDTGSTGVPVEHPAPLEGSGPPVAGGPVASEGAVPTGDPPAASPPREGHPGTVLDGHPGTFLSGVDRLGAAVDDARAVEPGSPVDTPLTSATQNPGVSSGGVAPEATPAAAGAVAATEGEVTVPGQVSTRGDGTVSGVPPRTDPVTSTTDAARGAIPQSPGTVSSGGRVPGAVGLPVDAVRVPVPADAVSSGGVAEFLRARVDDAGTGPVVLTSGVDSGSDVVVPSNQAADVARSLGRDIVALVPGRGRRGPRWMRFAADGARPRPVGGPGQILPPRQTSPGQRELDALTDSATAVPTSTAKTGTPDATGESETVPPVAETEATATGPGQGTRERPDPTSVADWTASDLRREVQRAKTVGGPRPAAMRIVQGTHDVVRLARGQAGVALEDVVALVAARVTVYGPDGAKRFSRKLAARLDTRGTGVTIRAGAGPDRQPDTPAPDQSADPGQAGEETAQPADPAGDRARKRGLSDGAADDGAARRPGEPDEAAERLGSSAQLSTPQLVAEQLREEARAEARRARDARRPYTAVALGQRFGRSRTWAQAVLAEIKAEAATTQPRPQEQAHTDRLPEPDEAAERLGSAARLSWAQLQAAQLREAARAEARRARDAGDPYHGASLGRKFGKSDTWGRQRLTEIKAEAATTQPRPQEPEQEAWPAGETGESSTDAAPAEGTRSDSAATAASSAASADQRLDVVGIGHGHHDAVRPAREDALPTAPVSLSVQGTGERADYPGWTRSPHQAATAPQNTRPLLVLGHNDMVVSGDTVARAHATGADVLARGDLGTGPRWLLYPADGSRPRPVDPPSELTRRPRPEPLLFRGPRDSSELIGRAAWLAPHLFDTQIVGVHMTGDGRAVLGDGSLLEPEGFAAHVLQDRRFVPGPNIALLGCAAYQRPRPGALSFAERFTRALGERAWVTDAEVFQTSDGAVHATETVITGDGRMLPVFVDGQGTGHWSLLDPDGREVLSRRGPELRAALTGMTTPRYTDQTAPEPLIRWSDNGDADPARLHDERDEETQADAGPQHGPEQEQEQVQRARPGASEVLEQQHEEAFQELAWVTARQAETERARQEAQAEAERVREQTQAETQRVREQTRVTGRRARQGARAGADRVGEEARAEAQRALNAGEPYTVAALGQRFGRSRAWAASLLAEVREAATGPGSRQQAQLWPARAAGVGPQRTSRAPQDADPGVGRSAAGGGVRSVGEMLRGWWAASADPAAAAGRVLSDEDVRRLTNAVEPGDRDGVGAPGAPSAERLRLIHALWLTEMVGGRPVVEDVRDVRLVADWVRDTGAMQGPRLVSAADVHRVVREATGSTTDARWQEVQFLADVVRRVEQGLEQRGEQRRATLAEVRAQWQRQATRAVTLRMGSQAENTVVYPADEVSARWWRSFRSGGVDLGQIRRDLGIADDSEPLLVVVEARRLPASANRSFLLGDELRNTSVELETPRELGQRVADTEQYQRVTENNPDGPVVLVILGGNAGLRRTRDALAQRFAEGLTAGGDSARRVLLAEGYISHAPAGLGLTAAGSRPAGRQDAPGLVLSSGAPPSFRSHGPIQGSARHSPTHGPATAPWSPRAWLTIPAGPTMIDAVAFPRNSDEEAAWRRWAESGPDLTVLSGPDLPGLSTQVQGAAPILVLANRHGFFDYADPETWAPVRTGPEEFGAAVAEALGQAAGLDASRAVVVFAVQLPNGGGLREQGRQGLANGISRHGHDGPVYVADVVQRDDGGSIRLEIQGITLAERGPRDPELPVRELNSSDPGRHVLAAGGTSADADWWNQWSSNGVQVSGVELLGLDSTTVVLARLRGSEFVTPSGTMSAFEFGRQVTDSVPYQTSTTQHPDAPVLLATVGAETGLSEDAAHEFARGVRGNDPDRTVLVTDRDFRLRRENDLAELPLEADLLRFVPPPNWFPGARTSRPADGGFTAVLTYPSLPGPTPTPTVDTDWFASETGHRKPLVVMARSVRGRFHVLDPSTDQTWVLGPSDFGTSVARSTEFQQAVTDDLARPVVVVFNRWHPGLTEQDARALAEGLRGDGIQRPVFLSLGRIQNSETGARPHALAEAPSTQSALLSHPASAADARQPLLLSALGSEHIEVLGQLHSYGVSRLLSQLGYSGTQQPIVVLTNNPANDSVAPLGRRNVRPTRLMGTVLAGTPDYLEAIRGDWRRPIVIVPVGEPNDPDPRPQDFTDFTTELLGNPDTDRPVYLAEHNIHHVEPGLRLLTPERMRPPPAREDLVSHSLRVGVGQESAVNAVGFPAGPDLPTEWTGWGSLERTWYGPALRRAMSEFDPDPLFVFVPVRNGQIVVRDATGVLETPDPVALGLRMQQSPQFQDAGGHIDRTVVIVADFMGPQIPDWYARALAEGLRRTGGPPRPLYVYDGYNHAAFHTDEALGRLRNVTPELNWQRSGQVRDPDDPLEIVPHYVRGALPAYDSAGEVASAVAAVDRQRQAALASAARATQPAEATEAEIATLHHRWNEQFHEAERTLSTLPADWVADLQARARTILASVWPRPRQGDTLSAMAMQGLWDRMAQRVAFRLYHDGRSETGAWADAAAMAATVPSLPVVLTVRGSDESVTYPTWTRSPGHAQLTPDRDRLLVVLGTDHSVVLNELIAEAQRSGADVLARTDTTNGPQWILFRADGREPLPVEPPAELTRLASPAPLMYFGPDDDAAAVEAVALASDLPGVQVVGIHITPSGNGRWPDGEAGPEESAARVWRDRRFVAGLPVALFGCGAARRSAPGEASFAQRFTARLGALCGCATGRRSEPGEASFAQQFATSLGLSVWTTDASEVWQTRDGAVHATDTVTTADGRMQPMFTNGQGTGQWSLLGPDGREVLSHRGPELRAALTGTTPPRYPDQAHPEPVIRWSDNGNTNSFHDERARLETWRGGQEIARPLDELLSGWWTARADGGSAAGRQLSDDDVRRLADAVELRYRDGAGGPGTRSGERLRGRLVNVLELTEGLGGQPTVADVRDIRLVADWVRDTGRMPGPTVTAADVHSLVHELTETTTNVRPHELSYLADVLRRVEQEGQQRRATVPELRAQWRHGATQAVTLRMGAHTDNTVAYPASTASSRWWGNFHGGRVDLDQIRQEMGITADREPVIVVVEARRRTAGAEKSFLISDEIRGATAHLDTPRELGQRVAGTEQYQRVAATNQDGPVVLVVTGGNAALGVHLSRDELTQRFAEGLNAGGDGIRQVLLAEGYVSHDPAGLGLIAAGPQAGDRQNAGLVLPSGTRASVVTLRLESAQENTIAYPINATDKSQLLSTVGLGLGWDTARADSPIFVLAWITPTGGFTVADGDTWETQDVSPREFARRAVEDARSHGIARPDDERPIIVRTYAWDRHRSLPERARHELAESFREAGHHGPVHVLERDIATERFHPAPVVQWSPRARLTIPAGSTVLDAVAYSRNSGEEAVWRRWAESEPDLDDLLERVRDESPVLVLARWLPGRAFAYFDPATRASRHLSAGAFGREVAGALGEIASSNPGKTVVVLAMQRPYEANLGEPERQQLANGLGRFGHHGPVYVATVVEIDNGDTTRIHFGLDINLAGGQPRDAELPVHRLARWQQSYRLLAAGGTSADMTWWHEWSTSGFRVSGAPRLGLRSTTVVLARLWGDEFVTPSGTLSAFEFGREVTRRQPYRTVTMQDPDAPVLLATVGAETGLSEHAAHEFARGLRQDIPDLDVLVTDRDFRLRRENDAAVLQLNENPPRFVPPPNWSPEVEVDRSTDDDFVAVLTYPSRPGRTRRLTVDADWFVSEAGHRTPLVVVAPSVHGRFHVFDPSIYRVRVLGPADFGTSVARNAEFHQAVSDDPARPVVVVFDQWPSGLTERDARALAEGLRSDGIRRPVFLSMGKFQERGAGWRPYSLVEAPSAQSMLLTHPASAAGARRPALISYLDPSSQAEVLDQVRSLGISRLLSELGYRGAQHPIVVLTSAGFGRFMTPYGELSPAQLGDFLAEDPKYLEATQGDWRRPVVIVPVRLPPHYVDEASDITPLTAHLLGTPDADRPVYISADIMSVGGLTMQEGGRLPGPKLLTPERMQPPGTQQELGSQTLRVGVGEESALNAVGFPVESEDLAAWEDWGSLNYDGYGPMLRRAVGEFDPDPLFVFVKVSDEQVVVVRDRAHEPEPRSESEPGWWESDAESAPESAPEPGQMHESPDPVELGMLIQRSPHFQHLEYPTSAVADAGQLGRTVVIVPMSENGRPLPDWYARALAEGMRRVGGPPRPVYVYDGYHNEAYDTDSVLDRLRSVTPELHWRQAGEVRDPVEPREIVPHYERDSLPSYENAGEVASAVAAADQQREAALSGAARPTRPAEVTEAEIATVRQRWNQEFQEAERALSTLTADRVADLQARASTILAGMWQRPRQGDTSPAMAMQDLWDRMAQRVAFQLSNDGRSETGAWADAAAMAATIPSLPVVLAVRGSDEPVSYPAWTRSLGFAQVSPDRGQILVVLGSDHIVVPGESVAEVRRSGVNVLARTDIEEGPRWTLFRSDGREPLPAEPPAELTRLASPAPLMVFGPADDAAAYAAMALASDLPGVQVVGMHVTPHGRARWPDGETGPEESAERVWRDRRFVAGLPVALFGCGAGQRPEPGDTSFAQRFAARMRAYVWTTDATDVWQTNDGAVHATDTIATADGRMQPMFTNGQGTGQWSLLGPDGREVLSRRGPELRAALTGTTPPRYPDHTHPEPVIKWSDDEGAESAESRARVDELDEARRAESWSHRLARVEARRAHNDGEPITAEALGAMFGLDSEWGAARLAEIEADLESEARGAAREMAREADEEGDPCSAEDLGERFGRDSDWGAARLAEMREEAERDRAEARALARRAAEAGEPFDSWELGAMFGRHGEWGEEQLNEVALERDQEERWAGRQADETGQPVTAGESRAVFGRGAARIAETEDEDDRAVARALARRADESGEPFPPRELGAMFGRDSEWAAARIAEFEDEREREARTQARQAMDELEPYTPRTLGARFQQSSEWGAARLAEMREEFVRELEARAAARRARDAGEPYAAEVLGARFGQDSEWGAQRLDEIRQSPGELLSQWWAAREDGASAQRRLPDDEDVHRLADAVELRYRDGVGGPGTRSAERLRGRLVHVLELTQELGGQPTVSDVRNIRLVADWIRDTGRMPGPTVTANDVHNAVQELTETPTNTRPHELRYLAEVLRQAEQGGERQGPHRATASELRAQWQHGATRAITLRMGTHTDNTVAYPASAGSSRWWQDFHGGRVNLDQLRQEMGITPDRQPVIIVVEARRRTAGAEKSFLISDEIRGTTAHLDTPRELGRRVAGTAQYQQIATSNPDGPVVLVVTGGNAALGPHLSRDELTHEFGEGLNTGGDNNRQVLLAEGYVSHNPAGLGLVAAGPPAADRQHARLVLPSGVQPSVLALRPAGAARENTIAYPIDAGTRDAVQRLDAPGGRAPGAFDADAPTFVLAHVTPQGGFIVADRDTWQTQQLSPHEFAHRVIEDARSYGITHPDDRRALILNLYDRGRGYALPEPAQQELAASFREAGHRGPVSVMTLDTETGSVSPAPMVPWSPRVRLAIPTGSRVIDAIAYPRNSDEEASWRHWAESGPDLDRLLAGVRDESPILVLTRPGPDGTFTYTDPGGRYTRNLQAGEFGRFLAGVLGETASLSRTVVVFAAQSENAGGLGEQTRRELASGIRRHGHAGPVYVAAAVESEDGGNLRFEIRDIALAGGRPREAELSVRELAPDPWHRLLAAGATSADVDWWSQWSSDGFRVTGARRFGMRSATTVLARLWGDEFVTPSGTVSAFEFGRQLAHSTPYQTSITALPSAPVLLATVGAETGLSENTAHDFARGVHSNDPNRTILVTDRDFRLRHENGVPVLPLNTDPPRFVPAQDWLPAAGLSLPDDDGFEALLYLSRPEPRPPLVVDTNWLRSEVGHRRPVVLVARSVRGRFHLVDPSNGETRVLGPSDFGMSVARGAEFRQAISDDQARPVVVMFDQWPSGLTERDARALAEGLRSDGIQRPVFLSMGQLDEHETGRRPYALVEAPSAQSALRTHPASAIEARRPQLISCLGSRDVDDLDQIRSFGISRLLSRLEYRGPQEPIVILASTGIDGFLAPGGQAKIPAARLGAMVARNPDYLAATRGDWRRPVVILPVGAYNPSATANLNLAEHLLGNPDADRPVYVSGERVPGDTLTRNPDERVVWDGLRLLTPRRMQPPPPHRESRSYSLRLGVGQESAFNAVAFPVGNETSERWETFCSLDYDWHGPMLRRAVGEFDPDPLFVLVKVSDGKVVVARPEDDDPESEPESEPESPDPVELGMLIQRSPHFQNAGDQSEETPDPGQLGRTVVIVADSEDGVPLPDWYARALAEGLRRVGGPPRPVYVYDSFHQEAPDTDTVLDRLRDVTPELHWRTAGEDRDAEVPRQLLPPYERDLPPSYDNAGEVASAITSVDRQLRAALSGTARPTQPAEVTEAEIATVHQRWTEQFQEAEGALTTLSANWVADLQARARTILGSLWQRPGQGDTPSTMAMQALWDRMAQRIAYRLAGDGRSEADAWADAAAMAATIPSLPVVRHAEQAHPEPAGNEDAASTSPVSLSVQGARERAEYAGWTRSAQHAAAAPHGARPLLVLGHDETVISGDAVVAVRDTGADVLARVDVGLGPKWMLYRTDGSRPRLVDPPADLTRPPTPGTVPSPDSPSGP
ncbi:WXG100-like domain-containing protein [Saccharopolyspora phatthalungensis]